MTNRWIYITKYANLFTQIFHLFSLDLVLKVRMLAAFGFHIGLAISLRPYRTNCHDTSTDIGYGQDARYLIAHSSPF
jgi:hypothetical protein